VDEYIRLLELYTGRKTVPADVSLQHNFSRRDHIVVNINSEASSRRLTTAKAIELLNTLRSHTSNKIILIGAPKEKEFVEQVMCNLVNKNNMESVAGKTTLPQLVQLLAEAKAMLTTDSGPAHLANALGIPTTVLFGAGNENHTAPYNKANRDIIRLGQLSCEPCEKNICVRYETPQCLERLNGNLIVETVKQHING
jgi:ADP-heptose:LPS heptosyltransferase